MRAPAITYRFTWPKDTAGPTLEIMSRAGSATVNAATITTTVAGVPIDRILILTNITVNATPAAGVSVSDIQIGAITQAALNFNLNWDEFVAVAGQARTANWEGEVWVQGRGVDVPLVNLFTRFSAAGALNSLSFGLQGLVIPRGNAAAF